MSFDSLAAKIKALASPTVAGLDPKIEYVPSFLVEQAKKQFGDTPAATGEALRLFNKGLIDALCDVVPAVKPQSAYYELYGKAGQDALAWTIAYAKSKGMYVILDVKRGDIGATSEAYAGAYLAGGDYSSDCITVNPYLGSDGVLPFVDMAKANDRAIFALVKTSNKSSGEFQDVLTEGGAPLYRRVADKVVEWGADNVTACGYSRVGAVVGATYPAHLAELRKVMPQTFFLIPAYGAQGGTAQDLKSAFAADGSGAVVNSSRAIMCAYMKKGTPETFADAARAEAVAMRDAIAAVLS